MRVTAIGSGYVGLGAAACFTELGLDYYSVGRPAVEISCEILQDSGLAKCTEIHESRVKGKLSE